ncbi:MAG: hypothetical protein IKE75_06345 [Bacilli bacterium]|nr:hypothetical protein [Bacilli bacterium]
MIAVLIFAHKNMHQTRRLIDKLKNESVDIYMHVDSKCDFNEDDFNDVKLLERHDISWGNLNNVKLEVLMSSLKKIVDVGKYERIIYMSGQDYLLRPIDEIVKFLKNNKKNYLSYGLVDQKHLMDRFLKYRFKNKILDRISVKLSRRKNFYGDLDLYWGSEWWMLTADAVKIIVSEYFSKYRKYMKHTLCMDEMIWQTILLNSDLKNTIINDNKWYITWNDYLKGLNIGNPDILKEKDYEDMIKSDKFFARKFDVGVDSKILDLLDKHISNGG